MSTNWKKYKYFNYMQDNIIDEEHDIHEYSKVRCGRCNWSCGAYKKDGLVVGEYAIVSFWHNKLKTRFNYLCKVESETDKLYILRPPVNEYDIETTSQFQVNKRTKKVHGHVRSYVFSMKGSEFNRTEIYMMLEFINCYINDKKLNFKKENKIHKIRDPEVDKLLLLDFEDKEVYIKLYYDYLTKLYNNYKIRIPYLWYPNYYTDLLKR